VLDIKKLPEPQLVEEIDYNTILKGYVDLLKGDLPNWTASDADPVKKVLRTATYREMLLRQRVNEAARNLLLAFAKGSNLDHVAAFFGEERLKGANAQVEITIKVNTSGMIPAGFLFVNDGSTVKAKLLNDVIFGTGETEKAGLCEIITPEGSAGNGISGELKYALTPLPFITDISQATEGQYGAETESDEAFLNRIILGHSKKSTAGSKNTYKYYTFSADSRIKDVSVLSSAPGHTEICLLSHDGSGAADDVMIQRVADALDPQDVRPQSDVVTVTSAEIIEYVIEAKVYLFPDAPISTVERVQANTEKAVKDLHKLGYDINDSIKGRMWAEGVQRVELVMKFSGGFPITFDKIIVTKKQAAFCTSVSVTFGGLDE